MSAQRSAGGVVLAVVIAVTLAAVVMVELAGLNGAEGSGGPSGDKGTNVTEVRLSDGTRCAVMDKAEGAAIDCDWKP